MEGAGAHRTIAGLPGRRDLRPSAFPRADEANAPSHQAQGQQVGTGLILTRRRQEETVKKSDETVYDYVIVGAGPAGLQLAYFLEKAGRSYQVLESGPRPGTFFETFPRHRTLISINKVYTGREDPEFNLRHDWNSLLTY